MLDCFGNESSKLFHQLTKLVSQEPEGKTGGKGRIRACQVSYAFLDDGNAKKFPKSQGLWQACANTPWQTLGVMEKHIEESYYWHWGHSGYGAGDTLSSSCEREPPWTLSRSRRKLKKKKTQREVKINVFK